MQKAITKISAALFCASAVAAIVLRAMQLLNFTDVETGHIVYEAKNTIAVFFVLCAASAAFCAVLCCKNAEPVNPFEQQKSKPILCTAIAAGVAMFYGFIHQCILCGEYISSTAYFELNYFIPLCLAGVSALLSAFYFSILGISFVTDKYDFRYFKYFHIVPVLWCIFMLFTCLTRYDDGIFAEESILHYAVLIFGTLFFLAFVRCVDKTPGTAKGFCFLGFLYGFTALVLAVPRLVLFAAGEELSSVSYSSIPYLFTGIFAITISAEAFIKNNKSKEG